MRSRAETYPIRCAQTRRPTQAQTQSDAAFPSEDNVTYLIRMGADSDSGARGVF